MGETEMGGVQEMNEGEKLGQSWQQRCCCKMAGEELTCLKRERISAEKRRAQIILTTPAWSDRWWNIVAYHKI